MNDNFDLQKFLKENKTMEQGNPYLAKSLKEEDSKDSLREKIREMVLAELATEEEVYEAKADDEEVEDVEVEDTEEVDIVDDEDMPEGGFEEDSAVGGDEGELMDHLEAAIEVARGLGDEELVTQLGNTITFFTRQHIAK